MMGQKTILKKDVSTGDLLEWDQLKGKPSDESLRCIYDHAKKVSEKHCEWYWRSIRTKRRTSLAVRFTAFLLLIAGTALPIAAAVEDDIKFRLAYTQYAVAILAIAALLQLADRVFGWSSGWTRYITTVTLMEGLTRQFELDWAKYMLANGASPGEKAVMALFELAQSHEQALIKNQSEETQKWVADFNSGLALLESAVKVQREVAEKARDSLEAAVAAKAAAEKEEAKKAQPGMLEVSLAFSGQQRIVRISVDGDVAEAFRGMSWVKQNVSPGNHVVHVVVEGTPPLVIQRAVQIAAGQPAKIEIALP